MRVVAPGKLIFTGAYAVLEGAPAIVIAVDRYACAAAASPDEVDVRALHDGAGRKIGLGSSSAAIVASLGARAVERGEDLRDAVVRAGLFRAARDAHARSQGGGSGADVAAAVHGGALRYFAGKRGEARVRSIELPPGLVWRAFWSGASARTSDLVARVDALRGRDPNVLRTLHVLAARAAAAVDSGDTRSFVGAARDYSRALQALGRAADAPLVPAAFAELAALAADEHGACLPSGAGGGDVAVWLSSAQPSASFFARAEALSMVPLELGLDRGGVRTQTP
jgi:phosphomevalonate kinase